MNGRSQEETSRRLRKRRAEVSRARRGPRPHLFLVPDTGVSVCERCQGSGFLRIELPTSSRLIMRSWQTIDCPDCSRVGVTPDPA